MKIDPAARCHIQSLCDKIQDVNLDPEVSVSFAGLCCVEEQNIPGSVISSTFAPSKVGVTDQEVRPDPEEPSIIPSSPLRDHASSSLFSFVFGNSNPDLSRGSKLNRYSSTTSALA
jgi:hypothetical protein